MKRRDYLAIITIILLIISSLAGVLSIDFSSSYEITNQYGHIVEIYGHGIYAYDSYFQATISIGTDVCIFFVVVPMFIYTYINYIREGDKVSKLKLAAVYAVTLYYAASIGFGLTYNKLFLVYVALFACSLFGMFKCIKNMRWEKAVSISKGLKIFLILSGIALIVAWLPDIILTIIEGTTLPLIGVYTTAITYILDMGIISPICFVCIYLLSKKDGLGTILLATLLKACVVVGIMMITQTISQTIGGCDLPIIAVITKSLSFVLLGGFAYYFERKMYKEISYEKEL